MTLTQTGSRYPASESRRVQNLCVLLSARFCTVHSVPVLIWPTVFLAPFVALINPPGRAPSCQTPSPEGRSLFGSVSRSRYPSVEQQVRCGRGRRLWGAGSQEVVLLEQTHLGVVKQHPFAVVFQQAAQRLLLR